MQNYAFVRDWITYPYLSVEFKRNGELEDMVVRQVCAASTPARFSRCYLYAKARKATSKSPTSSGLGDADNGDMAAIRYYALTFYRPQIRLLDSTADLGRVKPVGWIRYKETVSEPTALISMRSRN